MKLSGLNAEVEEMSRLGLCVGLIFPAYLWISKSPDASAMSKRSLLAGTAVVAAAIGIGLRSRK